jgi:hypothetical protein
MVLKELFDKYGSDKGTLGYGPVYEFYFKPVCEKLLKVLELGVWQGASLRAWRDYFPSATIIGIDEQGSDFQGNNIFTHVGRQEDAGFLNSLIAKYQLFDIIIDDCGHCWEPQQISFNTLWPAVNSGGFYIIEDLETSFDSKFSGGYSTNTVEYLLRLAFRVIADKNHSDSIEYIHFYPNQAVIKKVSK